MIYPYALLQLEKDFNRAAARFPDTSITRLAQTLIDKAKALDLSLTQNLGVNFRYNGVVRDHQNPPTFTHESILGADWADASNAPLLQGETWNAGRRATATGQVYALDNAGHPINPYMNTGLAGRGCLGQFGPNHAVDNGVIVLRDDETGVPALYALGILRKYDGDAPAFAGGFAKFKKSMESGFVLDEDSMIQSRTEEFFEEMVSGSVELLPAYSAQVEEKLQSEIEKRMQARSGAELSEDELHEIRDQIETGLKLQQVHGLDPDFLVRLRALVAGGKECFAGPALNDNRVTNNAWIETRLSWFMLDEEIWKAVRGLNPAFDYQFSAGDDASGVRLLKIDNDLIGKAFASHGPMFMFMVASFLLDAQERGKNLPPSILPQMQEIVP